MPKFEHYLNCQGRSSSSLGKTCRWSRHHVSDAFDVMDDAAPHTCTCSMHLLRQCTPSLDRHLDADFSLVPCELAYPWEQCFPPMIQKVSLLIYCGVSRSIGLVSCLQCRCTSWLIAWAYELSDLYQYTQCMNNHCLFMVLILKETLLNTAESFI